MFNKKIDLHSKTIKNLLILLIFISISCIIFLFLLVRPVTIGISYDWDTTLSLNSFIKTPLNYSWINNTKITPGNYYYIQILYWFLLKCHLSSTFITISFLILIFSFSAFFLYVLIKKIRLYSWIAIMAGLLYLSTAQLLLITHHGYTSYLVSFCFTPLLVYYYLSYLEKPKFITAIIGAVVFNLAANQIQFFVINSIMLLVFSGFFYKHWKKIIRLFLIIIIINILLSASWLLVYLYYFQSLNDLNELSKYNSYSGFQNNDIMDLFYIPFVSWSIKEYLQSIHLEWFYYLWSFCQILIFSLPFLIYGFFRKKINPALNKLFTIGFVLLMFGFLLTKGRAEPFSWLGDWFYKLPLSGMFRDLNHFYYIITFNIIWLFALAVYVLYTNFKKEKKQQCIFFSVLILFLLINLLPYILNIYQSRLHRYQFEPDAYSSLIEKYNNDLDDFRVLWLPNSFYIKYGDEKNIFSGRNPLINMITKEDLPSFGFTTDQPSLLNKVVEFGYCAKIKNCTERFLGLYNVRDIIHLKRNIYSTAPTVDNKNVFRNENNWTPKYYASWVAKLTNTVKTDSTEYFDIYQLSNSQYLLHIYVPKKISWIQGNEKNILDGIILNDNAKAGYIINNTFQKKANKLIIPIEFSEDSGLEFFHNDYQIITKLNIPEDGDYQMIFYQKHDGTTSDGIILSVKNLNLTAKEIVLEKIDSSENQFNNQNPYKTGNIFLEKGEYKLILSNTVNNQNLVINPSFESGAWPVKTYDCIAEESDYKVIEEDNRQHYLQFNNQEKKVCQTVVVGDLQTKSKYLFSYDLQHLKGENPVVCLKLNDEDYCHGINTIANNNNWQHFEFIYEQGESKRALIYFYVPESNNISVNNFDNFELRQVSLPETISFLKNKKIDNYQVSNVEYTKISNTKYRVNLKSASGVVPIIFSENYNSNWAAYANGEVINNHQKINGFSNIWYYKVNNGPKDVEIIIEYKPQKLFIIGQYIIIITISLITLYFVIYFIRKIILNKRKN